MRLGKIHLRKLSSYLVFPLDVKDQKRMLFLHTGWFISLSAEYIFWGKISSSVFSWALLFLLLICQIIRFWIMKILGTYWVPYPVAFHGQPLVKTGPYRYFKHPNYFIVTLELIIFPLWAGCYVTLFLGSVLNVIFLKRRISIEETALSRRLS